MKILPFLLLICVVLGCGSRGSAVRPSKATATRTPVNSTASLEKRRTLARGLDGTGGYDVKLDGPDEDLLVITHLMLSKAKAREFIDETVGSVPYESVGFREVMFQKSPNPNSKRWVYNFEKRSLKP